MGTPREDKLRQRVENQARRIQKAERARPTLLSQTVYVGTLGLLLVLPIVGGAFLGRWIDDHFPGYAIHWTVSLILVGVVVGAVNVYLFTKE
jgi:ATP synthase protein I